MGFGGCGDVGGFLLACFFFSFAWWIGHRGGGPDPGQLGSECVSSALCEISQIINRNTMLGKERRLNKPGAANQ